MWWWLQVSSHEEISWVAVVSYVVILVRKKTQIHSRVGTKSFIGLMFWSVRRSLCNFMKPPSPLLSIEEVEEGLQRCELRLAVKKRQSPHGSPFCHFRYIDSLSPAALKRPSKSYPLLLRSSTHRWGFWSTDRAVDLTGSIIRFQLHCRNRFGVLLHLGWP